MLLFIFAGTLLILELMKKIMYSSLFLLGFSTVVLAQSSQTIGLRFGSNHGLGTEVSYQKPLGEANRLEANLGWRSSDHVNAIKVNGCTNGFGIWMPTLIGMPVLEAEC